ncbi:methyl-accepting chemotaxis protein [Desulfovibrio inopinatus]|uniref:methyl-accepting chemotaxis protein n=1 Tax=Desulfovibrio inopinatus TaxID=102109 RepID=UPI00040526DF|nr:methyl-accepting chemotaxis protein [Desulfovibrio inopinatus]
MNISTRLILSVTGFVLLTVAASASAFFMVLDQRDNALVINLAGRQRMLSQMTGMKTLVYAHTASDDVKQQVQSLLAVFENTQQALKQGKAAPLTLNPNGKTAVLPAAPPDIVPVLDTANTVYADFKTVVESILDGNTNGEKNALKLDQNAQKTVRALNDVALAFQTQAEAKADFLLIFLATLVTVAFILGAIVVVNIRKVVVKPLIQITDYAKRISSGGLDSEPPSGFTAELATLTASMTGMVQELKNTFEQVDEKSRAADQSALDAQQALKEARLHEEEARRLNESLNDVANQANEFVLQVINASHELASRLDSIESGASLQRERMTETATAMDQMSSSVLDVAHNAGNAASSADKARQLAAGGAEGVSSAVKSIVRIQQQILSLKKSMANLGEHAESIGRIMTVISDIADQTNLLALNAAIEAARAGEAGRGFAVVADEVRKLAEKTMNATREVGQTVAAIQDQTQSNISATDALAKGVVDSTRTATASGKQMTSIVDIVGDTAAQVASIAAASEEQSASAEQITRSVDEVSRIATETSDGMSEAHAAVDQVVNIAESLGDLMSQMTKTALPA